MKTYWWYFTSFNYLRMQIDGSGSIKYGDRLITTTEIVKCFPWGEDYSNGVK